MNSDVLVGSVFVFIHLMRAGKGEDMGWGLPVIGLITGIIAATLARTSVPWSVWPSLGFLVVSVIGIYSDMESVGEATGLVTMACLLAVLLARTRTKYDKWLEKPSPVSDSTQHEYFEEPQHEDLQS